MNTNRSYRPSLGAGLVLGSFVLSCSLHAQVLTGFDSAAGYIANSAVTGIDDSGIPGTATWTSPLSNPGIASSANVRDGDLALRIQRTGSTSGASGSRIDLSSAGVSFDNPVNLSFSMAISNYSAGTGNQVQVFLGGTGFDAYASKHWLTLLFSDGALYLTVRSTDTTNTSIGLGAYDTYSDLTGYIDFSITFDPVAKKYTSVTLSGVKRSVDLSASFASTILPWIPGTNGDPGLTLTLAAGSNDIVTVDFDRLSISNIPEPSTFAVMAGLAGLALAGARRRHTRLSGKSAL